MNANLSELLTYMALLILVAGIGLFLIVGRDLAPKSQVLRGGGRWFLGAALGAGAIVLALKLVIILALSQAPQVTVAPLIAHLAHEGMPEGEDKASEDMRLRLGWQALPEKAPAPLDNPLTPEKAALGERLFFDPNLSIDRTVACASCHDVSGKAGADGRATALGIKNQIGPRNAPTVWNAAFQAVQFWDGRASSLEEQAKGPPVNPGEMGMPSLEAVAERVREDESYRDLFIKAFGENTAIDIDTIAKAIASYERTLITPNTPFDRFLHGEDGALSPDQKRGMSLFRTAGCITCHSGPNFSQASLFQPFASDRYLMASRSPLAAKYRLSEDKGKAPQGSLNGIWRIPSLRNVALTAPYFHNGAVGDLKEAVRVMAEAQLNAVIEGGGRTPKPGQKYLTHRDIDDLAAFLTALSSPRLTPRLAHR
ncbi:Cytochrome c peroxidase [Rhodospirillaceae bacterium LM-1]|nr:Cytochrome c peroxidase [Rhodospirillaceae bacterium LM-1]